MAEPLLQIEALSKRFGGVVAADDIMLDIPPGEFGTKLCDEDVDLGLDFTLSRMIDRYESHTLYTQPPPPMLTKPIEAGPGDVVKPPAEKPKTEAKPAAGSDKPAAGSDKPAAGSDKPAEPAAGSDKPAPSEDKKPPVEDKKPPEDKLPPEDKKPPADEKKAPPAAGSDDKGGTTP